MTREEVLAKIEQSLSDKTVEIFKKSDRRTYIEVKPEDIPEASRFIFRDIGARFQIASGIDTPTGFEILYHWALDAYNHIVTIKTKLDKEKPEIDSIAPVCVAAEWIEREMWELLGITFRNHPDMRRLLLIDDWPEGVYPLRRDYSTGGEYKKEKE